MTVILIGIIFILEIMIFLHISRRVEYYNPILLFIVLPIFYANALFFDFIFSGISHLELRSMNLSVSVYDSNYLAIVMLTFFFLTGVYFVVLLKNKSFNMMRYEKLCLIANVDSCRVSALKTIMVLFGLIYIFVLLAQIYGLDRDQIRSLSTPYREIITQTVFIFLCFSLIYRWKSRTFNLTILAILLAYSILSFQRENIVLVIFSLLLTVRPIKLSVRHVVLAMFLFALMVYYKAIVWAVLYFIDGHGTDVALSHFFQLSFRFTHVDPAASILMLSDFIGNSKVYSDYYGSYITNTLMQFLRIIFDLDWKSLGEFSTDYYTKGEMGTAFSMIIESILNFWYFGPFVLGVFITKMFYKTEPISAAYYKLHYFIWFMLMLKFIRTELAVVLKLYMLPAIIAYLLFIWASKSRFLLQKA